MLLASKGCAWPFYQETTERILTDINNEVGFRFFFTVHTGPINKIFTPTNRRKMEKQVTKYSWTIHNNYNIALMSKYLEKPQYKVNQSSNVIRLIISEKVSTFINPWGNMTGYLLQGKRWTSHLPGEFRCRTFGRNVLSIKRWTSWPMDNDFQNKIYS